MPNNLLPRYVWLIDTIRRYGRITRDELNARWMRSPFSNGEELPRRTFYNYRLNIEELFQIVIQYDHKSYEYYIEETGSQNESVINWLLNSAATSSVLSGSQSVYDRIFLEDVPSAREFLGTVIDALKEQHRIRFNYHPYTRSNPTIGVELEPYLLKIFKQRWYVTGRNVAEDTIKTYALDRMSHVKILLMPFAYPNDFDPKAYFRDSFGIVVNHSDVKKVVIRTDSNQAKYFRALPLHHSQREVIHDDFSVFYLDIRITQDFFQELLSYGPRITVLEPPELRTIMMDALKDSMRNYRRLNRQQ